MDDDDVRSIMAEASKVIRCLKESKHNDSLDLLERARKVKTATNDYASKRRQGANFLNEQVSKVRSRIEVNKELLKTTASNVAHLRSKLGESRPVAGDFLSGVTKENIDEKLNEAKMNIQKQIRELSSQAKGGSKLEKMLRKYQEIFNETTGLFKKVPDILEKGVPTGESGVRSRIAESDRRAEQMLQSMSTFQVELEPPRPTPEVEIPEVGVGSWIRYEGFDTQEELERFKSLYRKMTGRDPDEDVPPHKENTLEVLHEQPSDAAHDELEYFEKVFKELIGDADLTEKQNDNVNFYQQNSGNEGRS